MSWPLGYSKPSHQLNANLDGSIAVNGVVVTEPEGWIDVPMPVTAHVRGAPDSVSLRLRVGADEDGYAFLYGEQIDVAGRRYAGLHALIVAEGAQWMNALTRAIFGELSRRADTTELRTRATRPLRAVAIRGPVPAGLP